MKFEETSLPGVFLIGLEPAGDDRGFFARTWCRREFAEHGLTAEIDQVNVSQNNLAGTLRGMHMQTAPYAEAKLVRCIRGTVFDIAVDMRESSESYLHWVGYELSDKNRNALFIPEGFAHGYLTLTDDTEVFYLASESYAPGAEAGFRYNDPKIGIEWPADINVISDKDAAWPLL